MNSSEPIQHGTDTNGHRPQPALIRPSAVWLVGLVTAALFSQVLSLIGPAAIRLPLRLAGPLLCIGMFVRFRQAGRPAPMSLAVMAVIGLLLVLLANPAGNSFRAQLIQIVLYGAVLSPVFLVGRFDVDGPSFRGILIAFWAFHAISSGVGIVQSLIPRDFDPALSPVLLARGPEYVDSLKVILPSGGMVLRPMGLTDQPGGAAMAGLLTIVLGLGLLLTESSTPLRALWLTGMALGMVCLFVGHSKSTHLLTAVSLIAFCAVLGLRGDLQDRLLVLLLVPGMIVLCVVFAISEPTGQSIRISPSRTVDESFAGYLSQHPLGMGLGRWGIANHAFGRSQEASGVSPDVQSQWTGWVLDGGLPLLLAYAIAIVLAIKSTWRIGMTAVGEQTGLLGAMALAYNLAVVVSSFTEPLFIGTGGFEFWMVNTALFSAWVAAGERPRVLAQEKSALRRFRHAIGRGFVVSTGFEHDELPVTNLPTLVTGVIEPEIAPIGAHVRRRLDDELTTELPPPVEPPKRIPRPAVVISRMDDSEDVISGSAVPPAAQPSPAPMPQHATFEAVARQFAAMLRNQASNASDEVIPGPFTEDPLFPPAPPAKPVRKPPPPDDDLRIEPIDE